MSGLSVEWEEYGEAPVVSRDYRILLLPYIAENAIAISCVKKLGNSSETHIQTLGGCNFAFY